MSGYENTIKWKEQKEELRRLRDFALAFQDKPELSEEIHNFHRDALKIVVETCGKNSHEMMIIQTILEKLRRFRQFVNRARDQVERELEYEVSIVQNSDKYSERLFSEAAELFQSIFDRTCISRL